MQSKFWYLKNVSLFKGIPEAELMTIAESLIEKEYQKDDVIYSPHEDVATIFVVKRGEVRLFHSNNGKKTVFDIVGPGSIFGCLSSSSVNHFAQATHPTRICSFQEDKFYNILKERPEIMFKFINHLTGRVQDLEEKLQNRNFQAEELIYRELKKLQIKRRGRILGRLLPKSNVHITHEGLAELTGLNRVTVTRSLKRLKETNRIKIKDSGIELI